MSIWPFRRRTRRSKTGAGGSEKRHPVALHDAGVKSSAKTVRKLSKRRRTKSTSKTKAIEKDPEKQSYAYPNPLAENFPSPPDKENFPAQKRHRPGAHVDIESHSRIDPERRDNLPAYFFHVQSSHSNTSVDHRHNWEQLPTLKGKRSAASDSPLNRRYSRKKRKEDNHTREEEIRSMSASASIPNRPLTSPLSREGHQKHRGLSAPYRSASEGSLSFPESMHSSLSLNSEGGFIVKSLDLLSPRPRLRYSEAPPRYVPVSRTGSRRDDRKRTPLPEEDKNSKTIDELADELDASGLRELMERDNRRREKKRLQETDRMQRRLQRRAEKQRAEDEGRRQLGQAETPPPTSMHRGSLGREDVKLGIGGPSAQAQKQPPSAQSEPARDPSPSASWLRDGSNEDLRRVYNEDVDKTPSVPPSPTSHISPPDEPEKTELGTAQAVRLSVASSPRSHPSPTRDRPVSDISNLSSLRPLSTGKPPEPVETERRASDSGRKGQSPSRWTAFFRRSVTKPKRLTDDPERPASQFSTSRDSIPHPVVPAVMEASVWRKSGPPLRTTSKFREDLPESSASPSKIQSHSLDDLSSSSRRDPFASRDRADSGAGHHDRPSTSTEGFIIIKKSSSRSQDPFADPGSKENLSTGRMSLPEERAPSAALSQSLASIDSEGSWLSGKPSKRNSTPLNPMRSSGNSLTKHYGEYSDSAEDLGLDGDEYYTHLSPGPGHGRSSALRESGTAIASSDDGDTHMGDGGDDIDDDEEVGDGNERESAQPEAEWKDVASHQPTVIHREPHVKSREGLLNEFREGSGTPESPSPTQGGESPQFDYPGPHEAAEVRRATSVDLGKKHARHMSAGSAKLFQVHSSTKSQEGKRRSPPPPQPQ
ncbi:MAG: hypothetical protein M1840_000756 [Geoglossum simile]|nr:MAG: hypothetical protein M1840_000756 [Geoglossum simile]